MKPSRITKRGIAAAFLAALLVLSCQSKEGAAGLSAHALHERILTLDTHIDIPLTYMSEIDPSGETDLQVDLPKLEKGKLDGGFWIIYTPQGELTYSGYKKAFAIAEERAFLISYMVKANADRVELARSADDVRRIIKSGKRAIIMGMENAYPLGFDTEFEGKLFGPHVDGPVTNSVLWWANYGVRYIGITHFGHNQFGDSSNPNFQYDKGPKWNGLSPAGRELIKFLNITGIMVDVSHASKDTMMQAAELSKTPIIASHSGVKAMANSARNLDDEQLRKIAEVGGVAQIVAFDNYVRPYTEAQIAFRDSLREEMDLVTWPQRRDAPAAIKAEYEQRLLDMWSIAPRATVADFVDHIDYAVKVAGIDHVGIASDFDGGGGLDGWEDASQTPNVTAELVRRGYSEAQIAKIWGGNLLRVMEAAEVPRANQ